MLRPSVGGEWLLKLHGSVSKPDTIVLTRDDYLGFNSSRAALSALVKAHLLTHHLLFVGFGVADDHFRARSRRSKGYAEPRPGTAADGHSSWPV
ncbi:SIR2 family NAD-dependent protein deacylase [Paenarthrobacter nitroguajacolicus]|uniref:SIR2 family NAD-dependent protein deacylase n=1 Tax=Paenarthrobacter nitroguajacolicus TaxID=211146 RepID=UPI003ADB6141